MERVQPVLDVLSPNLFAVERVTEWPGTLLGPGYFANRYVYFISSETLRILGVVAEGLFDWINPALPDDLHFMSDGEVVMGSIPHHEFAWLNLETSDLGSVPPSVRRLIVPRVDKP
jgi:hypothetical protein